LGTAFPNLLNKHSATPVFGLTVIVGVFFNQGEKLGPVMEKKKQTQNILMG